MALAETKDTKSVKEVLELLSFPVEKQKIQLATGEPVPGRCVVRKEGKRNIPLSWVGESYGLVPHDVLLKPILSSIGNDEFIFKKTVIERDGRRVLVEAVSKESWSVTRGDRIRMKLCFMNSFDRTSSLKLLFGGFREVCSNGMGMFLKGYSMEIREVHTKLIGERVTAPDFQKNLEELTSGFKDNVKMLTSMADQKIDDSKAEELIGRIIGKKSIREIMGLMTKGRGQSGEKTAWSLYNGASQYLTDMETKAVLPVSAKIRTMKKTTELLRALNK